jgi:hypothetical protein
MQGSHDRMRALEQASRHLARAESEARAAQRFLDSTSSSEEEQALVRAVAGARTMLADAIETIRAASMQ